MVRILWAIDSLLLIQYMKVKMAHLFFNVLKSKAHCYRIFLACTGHTVHGSTYFPLHLHNILYMLMFLLSILLSLGLQLSLAVATRVVSIQTMYLALCIKATHATRNMHEACSECESSESLLSTYTIHQQKGEREQGTKPKQATVYVIY